MRGDEYRPDPSYYNMPTGTYGDHSSSTRNNADSAYPPNGSRGYGYSGGGNYGNGYAYNGAYGTPYGNGGRNRTRVKTVALIVSALVLIVATALIFGDFDSVSEPREVPEILEPDWDYFATMPPTLPDDWDDGQTSTEISIPRAETGTGVTLDITPLPSGKTLTFPEIYQKCSPAVVALTAETDGGYYWGSGVLFTADGYIVTNTHILEGTKSVTVTLSDDRKFEAELVGADSQSDIAVLKIDSEGLPFAEFGDSTALVEGEDVVAIGNPLGMEFRGTITNGIISAINRDVDYNGYNMTLLQTNAAINEGNSGGPLINMYGQVIGITNMKMVSYYSSIEGIGFAIPTSSMKAIIDNLIRDGRILGRPVIGVMVKEIDYDEYPDYPVGILIYSVEPGTDAESKGVKSGDVLTAVNGSDVENGSDVRDIIAGFAVGDEITLTLWREGEILDITITLADNADIFE